MIFACSCGNAPSSSVSTAELSTLGLQVFSALQQGRTVPLRDNTYLNAVLEDLPVVNGTLSPNDIHTYHSWAIGRWGKIKPANIEAKWVRSFLFSKALGAQQVVDLCKNDPNKGLQGCASSLGLATHAAASETPLGWLIVLAELKPNIN